MFDLMGWAFLALLCDYTLGILLIMAQFCIVKPTILDLGSSENHLALAYICFHTGVKNAVR